MTSLLNALHRSEQERTELIAEALLEPKTGLGREFYASTAWPANSAINALITTSLKFKFLLLSVFAAGVLLGSGALALVWLGFSAQTDAGTSLLVKDSEMDLRPIVKVPIEAAFEPELTVADASNNAVVNIAEFNAKSHPSADADIIIQRAPIFHTRPVVLMDDLAEFNSPKTAELPKVIETEVLMIEPKVASQRRDSEMDLSDVSPKLAKAFEQAMSETNAQQSPEQVKASSQEQRSAIPIDELPQSLRETIPTISYNSHVYSSSSERRRVKINGQELSEGDLIEPNLQLLEIRPNSVILRHKGQSFSLEALTDWPY